MSPGGVRIPLSFAFTICRQRHDIPLNLSRHYHHHHLKLFQSMSMTNIHKRLKSTSPTTAQTDGNAKPVSGFQDLDKPIKFTTSKASEWKATDTHGGGDDDDDIPSFQPFVVTGSVAIFLIYFCILREENDMDELMKKPLWERVPGLERQQLEIVLAYNKEHGLPTEEISERLQVLKEKQAQINKGK